MASDVRDRSAHASFLVLYSVIRHSCPMAKDTGKGSRKGAVTARTQSKNPKTGDYTKRNETPGSREKGQFMDVKSDGKPFKGVAKEPDKRRK